MHEGAETLACWCVPDSTGVTNKSAEEESRRTGRGLRLGEVKGKWEEEKEKEGSLHESVATAADD